MLMVLFNKHKNTELLMSDCFFFQNPEDTLLLLLYFEKINTEAELNFTTLS